MVATSVCGWFPRAASLLCAGRCQGLRRPMLCSRCDSAGERLRWCMRRRAVALGGVGLPATAWPSLALCPVPTVSRFPFLAPPFQPPFAAVCCVTPYTFVAYQAVRTMRLLQRVLRQAVQAVAVS